MSNLAQEEADLILNYKPSATSHPEDSHSHTQDLSEDERPYHRQGRIRSRHTNESDADTDDESAMATSTMTATRQNYTVPTTIYSANTGPKGVIADAQNYHRARQSTFRRTINSIGDSLSFSRSKSRNRSPKPIKETNSNSGSEVELSDEDEQFLAQWRQQRLAELQEQFSTNGPVFTGRKTYGILEQVNADGYLNAVENTPRDTNVVVLLNDPDSRRSMDVEDEIKQLAYKWHHVRFVKLHHEIAEMETVEIPAILAYRGGDVFATISGAQREGLEGVLREQGVLKK